MVSMKLAPAWTAMTMSLLLAAGTVGANGQNLSDDKGEQTEAAYGVELLELGDNLALYGIHTRDPMMLIQAARIKQTVATQELDAVAERGKQGAGAAAKDEAGDDLSAEALLDRAQVLAGGNEQVLAMIEEVRGTSVQTRGRVQGPAQSVNIVQAHSTNTYNRVRFRAGELAVVSLTGDGDTDLDLYVYDQNGNEICAAISWDDRERCTWTPRWTGPFSIEVRNLGGVWNRYVLTTN